MHNLSKNSVIHSTVISWNKLDLTIWNPKSFGIFKKIFLKELDANQTVFMTAIIIKGSDLTRKFR